MHAMESKLCACTHASRTESFVLKRWRRSPFDNQQVPEGRRRRIPDDRALLFIVRLQGRQLLEPLLYSSKGILCFWVGVLVGM